MRIRAPYYIFLIIVLIFLAFPDLSRGQAAHAAGTVDCNLSTPTPEMRCSKIPDIKIETAFPAHMIVNQSYLIRVALVSKTGSFSIPQTLEQATMAITEPTPVGTPDATVQQAFGPGFLPSAVATLNAGTFKVLSAPLEDAQYLDQPVVGWEWNVTPQFTGTQILSVDITATWKFTQVGSSSVLLQPTYRIGDPQLSIAVTEPPAHLTPSQPFFILGQFNLGELITQLSTGILIILILAVLFLWTIMLIRRDENGS